MITTLHESHFMKLEHLINFEQHPYWDLPIIERSPPFAGTGYYICR